MDTGILCNQLFITSPQALASNPNFGNIFETWVVCELIKSTVSKNDLRGLKSFLSEYKDKAKTAMIIYTGKECFKIDKNIWAIPWNAV